MTHPTQDELLLLAYGELLGADFARVEAHLGECAPCRAQFTQLESGRAMLETTFVSLRRAHTRWMVAVFAAAAVLATVVLTRSARSPKAHPGWLPTATWSHTAGYVTGGRTMEEIDAQLTRLEQERPYGPHE